MSWLSKLDLIYQSRACKLQHDGTWPSASHRCGNLLLSFYFNNKQRIFFQSTERYCHNPLTSFIVLNFIKEIYGTIKRDVSPSLKSRMNFACTEGVYYFFFFARKSWTVNLGAWVNTPIIVLIYSPGTVIHDY